MDMVKVLDVRIEVPDAVSENAVKAAEAWAREAATIALQQSGELTIREAAAELGLTHEEYLRRLTEKGFSLSAYEQDPVALDEIRQGLTA
jgi:hypothetical protein